MKKNKGFVAIDAVIAVIAVLIFSVLIITLMYTNAISNLKIRRETLATIYLTETLEKIGIAEFDEVTNENAMNFIPANMASNYHITIDIYEDINDIFDGTQESQIKEGQIVKKVVATFRYELLDKNYEYTMERIKIKG